MALVVDDYRQLLKRSGERYDGWHSFEGNYEHVNPLRRTKNKAPSTRIQIFFKTHLFISVLESRPHGDGDYGHREQNFSKMLPRVDFLKTLFSCCRVDGWKRSFLKTLTSQYRFTEYQSTCSVLLDHARAFYLLVFFHRSSNVEYRIWNVTAFSCGLGYF